MATIQEHTCWSCQITWKTEVVWKHPQDRSKGMAKELCPQCWRAASKSSKPYEGEIIKH